MRVNRRDSHDGDSDSSPAHNFRAIMTAARAHAKQ